MDARIDRSSLRLFSAAMAALAAAAIGLGALPFAAEPAHSVVLQQGDFIVNTTGLSSTTLAIARNTEILAAEVLLTDSASKVYPEGVDEDGLVIAWRSTPRDIVAYDPATGAVVEVIASGLSEVMALLALAGGDVLALRYEGAVLRIDRATGQATLVATLPGSGAYDLARAADGSIVIVANQGTFRLDLSTGAFGQLSSTGGMSVAVSPYDGTIYTLSLNGQPVQAIDPVTGVATPVPGTDYASTGAVLNGLAFHGHLPDRLVLLGESTFYALDLVAGTFEPYAVEGFVYGIPRSLFVVPAACNDGFDNDDDGLVDLADPHCKGNPLRSEETGGCGAGFDQAALALIPIAFGIARGRGRRRSEGAPA